MLLSWVACWCRVGVQFWAYLASWNCWTTGFHLIEDWTLFQSMSLNVSSDQSLGMRGSCCWDFLISHLRGNNLEQTIQ
jgi:hypothetical protein